MPILGLEFTDEMATAAVQPVVLSLGDGLWFLSDIIMNTPEAQSRKLLRMDFASYYRIGRRLTHDIGYSSQFGGASTAVNIDDQVCWSGRVGTSGHLED